MTFRAGNNGFTLIEIIIVLLLIGLASSVVVVSISNEFSKSLIRSESRKLYAALNHGREIAIARKTEVIFEIGEENRGYSMITGKSTFYSRKLPEDITAYSEQIIFYPIGDSSGGTVLLSDEHGRKYEVEVSNVTGRAKVRRIQSH